MKLKNLCYDVLTFSDEKTLEVNGECITQEYKIQSIKDYIQKEFRFKRNCPFCNNELNIQSIKKEPGTECFCEFDFDIVEVGKLWWCPKCAFWQFSLQDWIYGPDEESNNFLCAISKLKEFNNKIIPECKNELAQNIRRNPSLWNVMDPKKLEIFVKDIFSSFYANCEVYHLGKPYDGGVDVLFIDSGKNEWLIQVKRRSKISSSEGVNTIRNLLGTMTLENKKLGIVVSTADHFTYNACKSANRAKKSGYTIQLIDKNKLDLMLDPLIPKEPWIEFVNEMGIELDAWVNDMDHRKQLTLDSFVSF